MHTNKNAKGSSFSLYVCVCARACGVIKKTRQTNENIASYHSTGSILLLVVITWSNSGKSNKFLYLHNAK